jgi:hypothetical protein
MSHIRTLQEMCRNKFGRSLQKKIDARQGDLICAPRNLLPAFREVAREDLKSKILETQYIVQQAVNYWEDTRDVIDLRRINKILSKALSPQATSISNQNLNDAFILENEEEEVSFRAMIHSI